MRNFINQILFRIFLGAAFLISATSGLPQSPANKTPIDARRNVRVVPPRVNVPPPQSPPRIVADKNPVQLGEVVTFRLDPELSPRSGYVIEVNFNDGTPTAKIDRNIKFVQHRFTAEKTYTVSATVDTIAEDVPPDEAGVESATIKVQRVKLSAPASTEVGIPVSVTATSASKSPNLRFRFSFDDNEKPNWQTLNEAKYTYKAARRYSLKVEVGYADGQDVVAVDEDSSFINVALPPQGSLDLSVDAHGSTSEPVTLSANFRSDLTGRHIQYRFVFDDGQTSPWQDETDITHTYEVGTYQPSAEVGVLLEGDVTTLATSPRRQIEVTAAVQPPTDAPTQAGNPETAPTKPWWTPYLIPTLIVLVALLVLVILTAGLIGTYKAVKWAFAPEPTFVPHIDTGATQIAQDSAMPVIQFELHLDPNLDGGVYDIITTEPSLIRAERSHA